MSYVADEQAERFGQIALSQVATALSQYVGVAPHWVFSIDGTMALV